MSVIEIKRPVFCFHFLQAGSGQDTSSVSVFLSINDNVRIKTHHPPTWMLLFIVLEEIENPWKGFWLMRVEKEGWLLKGPIARFVYCLNTVITFKPD